MHKRSKLAIALAVIVFVLLSSCREESFDMPDYTVTGEDVTVDLKINIPEMQKQTRAVITEYNLNYVEDLWIRTYSASTGLATSKWVKLNPGTHTTEPDLSENVDISIDTQSGYTYIIGVANVSNLGVTKDNPEEQRPLSELLENADTWEDFINIAVVSPSKFANVNAPAIPLPMAGCYVPDTPGSHSHASNISEWQKLDFQSYFIPTQKNKVMLPGAIHLRRLVSHVTFNFKVGDPNLDLSVNSYKVFNVPKYSWLYERPTENGSELMKANFGDYATDSSDAEKYYSDIEQYPSQYIIDSKDENGDDIKTFNFWLGENKHTGLESCRTYVDRDKRSSSDGALFTSLTGDVWTPNNMASYVLVSCTLDYGNNSLNVNDKGEQEEGGSEVYRTGNAEYLIHLGYINQVADDFNTYRNGEYTYNVTVNGLENIRVDAFRENEFFGEEGIVNDLFNETIELDAHYHAFNIYLTQAELEAKDFGFIITTYRSGQQFTFDESSTFDFENASDDEAELYNWIELRATTDEKTLAEYKSRYAPPTTGKVTFMLAELTNGWSSMTQRMRSDTGWYTVFVNEYTYEPIYKGTDDYADESLNDKWRSYVNQNPRRFYIKVTKSQSADDNSVYARSKYGVTQQSMQIYYSTQGNLSTALGIERVNETEGLNMRSGTSFGTSASNGRYNIAQWLSGSNTNLSINNTNQNSRPQWDSFVKHTKVMQIGAVIGVRAQNGPDLPERTIASGNPVKLPKLGNYSGTKSATFSDPQGSNDEDNFIEAMNACMSRNRDNNGNGRIEPEELRWYIPAMGKYLRILLGSSSLSQPLMDYESVSQLPKKGTEAAWLTTESTNPVINDYISRYMFFASNGAATSNSNNNVLWAMEGMSTSTWAQANSWGGGYTNPWQVRCIRNLGTNLNTITDEEKVAMAYVFDASNRTVEMTYYDRMSIRSNPVNGNGTGSGMMPVHLTTSDYNMVYNKFEYYSEDITVPTDNKTLIGLESYINSNPCGVYNTSSKSGWRVPNQKELAILRNYGNILTGNDYSWLTCTASYFNMQTGVGGSYTNGENYFLAMLSARGTLLTPDRGSLGNINAFTMRVRCVRDVTN